MQCDAASHIGSGSRPIAHNQAYAPSKLHFLRCQFSVATARWNDTDHHPISDDETILAISDGSAPLLESECFRVTWYGLCSELRWLNELLHLRWRQLIHWHLRWLSELL